MIRRHGFPKEGFGSGDTAVRPQLDVDHPALLVDGSLEVGSLAPNLHIRLVDTLGAASGPSAGAPALIELRYETLDPQRNDVSIWEARSLQCHKRRVRYKP